MLRQICGSVSLFTVLSDLILSSFPFFFITKEYHNWQQGGRREAEDLKKEKMGQDRARSSIPHLLPMSHPLTPGAKDPGQ